ncbi:hypothetical protein MP228_007134 [Amoeboaphelidium protococcarum]|nr:hypothetical protein MP228_007134 [Amoeboaphelidium protococcarum]
MNASILFALVLSVICGVQSQTFEQAQDTVLQVAQDPQVQQTANDIYNQLINSTDIQTSGSVDNGQATITSPLVNGTVTNNNGNISFVGKVANVSDIVPSGASTAQKSSIAFGSALALVAYSML